MKAGMPKQLNAFAVKYMQKGRVTVRMDSETKGCFDTGA